MDHRAVYLALLLVFACAQPVNDAPHPALAQDGRQTVEFELGRVP